MEKQRMTALTDITIEGVGNYQGILSLKINTAANEHGTFLCRLRLEEDEIFVNEKDRTGDSVVVKDNKGEILFCGICTNSHTAKMSAYAELEIVAKGKTIETDRKARSRTFQDASKTLQGMLRMVMFLKGRKDFIRDMALLANERIQKAKESSQVVGNSFLRKSREIRNCHL